jgi:hypothetical protein
MIKTECVRSRRVPRVRIAERLVARGRLVPWLGHLFALGHNPGQTHENGCDERAGRLMSSAGVIIAAIPVIHISPKRLLMNAAIEIEAATS